MRAARACIAALIVVATPAGVAHGAGSPADRDAARSLAGKGYELLEAGQFARAIELFQQAEARHHAPSHWLYIARAQVKLGKLVEAEGSYQHLVDEQLAADAPKPFRDAQVSARAEIVEVRALVPTITIAIVGDAPSGTRFFIDGRAVDPKALGVPSRQNPGTHLVTGEPAGALPIQRSVTLKSGGGDTRVAFPFPRSGAAYIVPAAISFSLGAVGIGVGITTAIFAVHAKDPGLTRLRVAEVVGFAAGGAGVVAGVVLLAVRPRAPSTTAHASPPALRIGLGLGSISLSGEM